MSGTKPLIFVRPLSESLEKLHEVIKETAEEDGIEIYDVDDIGEVNQLLPSIGQSLTIFSNPKKCAAVLQTNKKAIHKLNSKIILLSSSAIPRKTLDKFSKIGLTECVVEPVPPKTLLYKVKLLLRSIATASEEDEQNEERKFSSNDETTNESKNEKQRLEKGIISSEDNVIDMNLKGKVGLDLAIDADETDDKKNKYREEDISTNWEGDLKEASLSIVEIEEEKNKKNGYQEEHIDNYLRNNNSKKSTTLDFGDDKANNKKKRNEGLDDDDDDAYSLSKKADSLILEAAEAAKKNKESGAEESEDDKFYKGKISKELNLGFEEDEDELSKTKDLDQEEEDIQKKSKKESMLELDSSDDENSSKYDDEEDSYKNPSSREKNIGLDIKSEEDEYKNKSKEEILEIEKRKKKDSEILNLEDDTNSSSLEDNSLNLSSDESENKLDNERNENDIEKYMKGKVANSITLLEEEEIDARNANDLEADEEGSKNRDNLDLGFELSPEEEEERRNETLKLLQEANKKSKDENSEEVDDSDSKSRNSGSISLNLEVDKDGNDLEKDDSEEDDKMYGKSHQKSLDLKVSGDDNEDESKKNKDEQEESYSRLKKSNELNLEVEREDRKHSGHTEHIQTNLDSRKSLKHQDYDWDINKNKDGSESYEALKKKKSEIEISFKQKVDLGEQTIDYRKLKSEFEAITITRVGNKGKKTGPQYTSEEGEKQFLKGMYDDEYLEAGTEILSDEDAKKVKTQKEVIYEPKSNGLEVAIKILNLYGNKKLIKEDLFKYVYNSLYKLYGNTTYFYSFDKNKNDFIKSFELTSTDELFNEANDQKLSTILESKISVWRDLNLPTWDNEKFNTPDNLFFYPLYEGANKLGFCVCVFKNNFDGKSQKSVEVILESLRGIFLDEFHKSGNSEKYDVKLEKKSHSKEDKTGILSFFGKLFGRAS